MAPSHNSLESVRGEVAQAEHGSQAQDRDRLEVRGHQLGATFRSGEQCIEGAAGDRRHEVVDVGRHDARPVLRVEAPAQVQMPISVDREDGEAAEGPVEGGVGDLGREQLRVGRDVLDVVGPRHEPQANGRDPGHRLVRPQARVERVRVVLELLDGDGVGESHGVSLSGRPRGR